MFYLVFILVLILSNIASGQTGGLGIVGGVIDFSSAATSTKLFKAVTSLPGTCDVQSLWWRTSDNTLWYCSATNTFTQFGSAGGSGTVNSGTTNQLGYYAGNGTAISGETTFQLVNIPAGALRTKSWTVIIGDPGSASPVLVNDNDSPSSVQNDTGQDITITSVTCFADAGSPTITPILTGGTGTSILTGALTCGTASIAAGTVNSTPTLHSFSGTSSSRTCSVTPCTIDVNITTAGGTARYIVVDIVGTY